MTMRATFATASLATTEELVDEDFARSIFERMIPGVETWFGGTCRHGAVVLAIEAGPSQASERCGVASGWTSVGGTSVQRDPKGPSKSLA
jgi:hypothetical protein